MNKSILPTASLLITSLSYGMEASPLFTWQDEEQGRHIQIQSHGVDKNGQAWSGRMATLADLPFYQELFGNPTLMKTVGAGDINSPEKTLEWVSHWDKRHHNGIPYGSLRLEQDGIPIGGLQFGLKQPGVGTFSRLLIEHAQGSGIGTSMLQFLVTEWAPAVRQMGLGNYPNAPEEAVKRLREFEKGVTLSKLYTTALPSNISSWSAYEKCGFRAFTDIDPSVIIACENWEKSQQGPLESYIMETYFNEAALHPLSDDNCYKITLPDDKIKTISYVSRYQGLRYHFEREV